MSESVPDSGAGQDQQDPGATMDWEQGNGAPTVAQVLYTMQNMLQHTAAAEARQERLTSAILDELRGRNNGESARLGPMPSVAKIPEFSGYRSELSPREWLAQAKVKCPHAVNAQAEDAYVRRATASFVGSALMLWNAHTAGLGDGVLLGWDRVERFLLDHFGRLEAPEVILPLMEALTLENCGGISGYVSEYQTLKARLGSGGSVAEDVHRFLRGLPVWMSTQLRLKFAGTNAPVQSYIDALCALPDRQPTPAKAPKAKEPDLGPRNAGVPKGGQSGKPKPLQQGSGKGKKDGDKKHRGPRCYECGQYGHIAVHCPTKPVGPSSACESPGPVS